MAILIFFICHWYLSLFSQTFFQHRYAALGAFTMSKFWERFFYLFAFITQGASYMSPRAYAIMHRMHHAYTDTEHDPHSPSYSTDIPDMMWRTNKIYIGIFKKTLPVEERFLKNLPDWPMIDRLGVSWISTVVWAVIYIAIYVYFEAAPWMYALIPVHLLMGPLHGTIINWFAHKFGSVNHELKNTSRNLLPVDVLMLGEAYHNNHHKHPSRVNFGQRWYEFDPVYPVIRVLDWLKVVRIKAGVQHSH